MKHIIILLSVILPGCSKKPINPIPLPINTHIVEVIYKPQYNHSYFTLALNYPNGEVIGVYQDTSNNVIIKTYTLTDQPILVSGKSYNFIQGTDTMIIKIDGIVFEHFVGISYSRVINVN
jgi:hypothetical protein